MKRPGLWRRSVGQVVVWGLRSRHAVAMLLLGTLALASCASAYMSAEAASTRSMHQDPVYTVAEVQDNLTLDPGGWAGRTVRVRGVAQVCLPSASPASVLHCIHRPQDLLDPGLGNGSEGMLLVWSPQRSWLAFLRRVPALGTLMPAAQSPHWGAVTTYRVQLRAVPAGSCTGEPCYEALLLDAAP